MHLTKTTVKIFGSTTKDNTFVLVTCPILPIHVTCVMVACPTLPATHSPLVRHRPCFCFACDFYGGAPYNRNMFVETTVNITELNNQTGDRNVYACHKLTRNTNVEIKDDKHTAKMLIMNPLHCTNHAS